MEDASWLADYLISVEKFVFDDLSVIQKHAMPCFPPAYQINQFYITRYHENLCKLVSTLFTSYATSHPPFCLQVTDLIDKNLTAKDIIFLRLWVRDLR